MCGTTQLHESRRRQNALSRWHRSSTLFRGAYLGRAPAAFGERCYGIRDPKVGRRKPFAVVRLACSPAPGTAEASDLAGQLRWGREWRVQEERHCNRQSFVSSTTGLPPQERPW